MDDYVEYELHFDAYTPDTIPMERLARYMTELAKLLANNASVHFDRLEAGSTRQFARVEKEAAPKVLKRINEIQLGEAANDAIASFDEINNLLRDDNAVGKLNLWIMGETQPSTVLIFKGRELPKPQKFGPFTEPAIVDGELIRIGGKDATAHATILDAEGKAWNGEMTRELAKDLAQYIYCGPILRVRGDAKWERREDGAWYLLNFKIHSYDTLQEDTLLEARARLIGLQASDWSKIEDIDATIKAERDESEGLH